MNRAMARRMPIAPDVWVTIEGRRFCIIQVLDLETVLVQDTDRGETRHAKIGELQPVEAPAETPAETAVAELAIIKDSYQQALSR
jgi:hypothetical protein